MEFKKYIDKAKKTIDEDKLDIKGKSKKLAKEVGKKVATAEGVAGIKPSCSSNVNNIT